MINQMMKFDQLLVQQLLNDQMQCELELAAANHQYIPHVNQKMSKHFPEMFILNFYFHQLILSEYKSELL